MKNKFKFTTKKLILTAASVALAVTLTGCPELESLLSERSSSEITQTSNLIKTTETAQVTDKNETTVPIITPTITENTKISETTGYNDNFDPTIPTKESSIDTLSDKFSDLLMNCNVGYYGAVLGFDNPYMLKFFREATGDPNLNLSEVGYFQEELSKLTGTSYIEESYSKRRDDPSNQLYSSVSSYILSKLEKRQFIDEIDTQFIKENFPEYFDLVNEYGSSAVLDDNLKQYLKETSTLDEFIKKVGDNNLDDYLERLVIYSIMDYNKLRIRLNSCYDVVKDKNGNEKNIYVIQGTTPDGKHVLQPTKSQYDYLMSDIKYCDSLTDVKNLYEPITEENLRNSGLNYDLYEHYFEDVLNINFNVDNSEYVFQEDQGQSRTRTS